MASMRVLVLLVVCALVGTACGDAGRSPSGPPVPASSSAAPPERPGPGDHRLTIDVGGVARTYLLHAPPGYTGDAPLPLVVAMPLSLSATTTSPLAVSAASTTSSTFPSCT